MLAYVMWLDVSVVDSSVSWAGKSYSRCETGWLFLIGSLVVRGVGDAFCNILQIIGNILQKGLPCG